PFAAHEADREAAPPEPLADEFGAGRIGLARRVDGREADEVGGKLNEVVHPFVNRLCKSVDHEGRDAAITAAWQEARYRLLQIGEAGTDSVFSTRRAIGGEIGTFGCRNRATRSLMAHWLALCAWGRNEGSCCRHCAGSHRGLRQCGRKRGGFLDGPDRYFQPDYDRFRIWPRGSSLEGLDGTARISHAAWNLPSDPAASHVAFAQIRQF